MYGLTNASKGVQDAATQDDINTALATAEGYTDTKVAAIYRGYPTSTGTSFYTASWNTQVTFSDATTITVTLPANPASTDTQTHELRLVVKFAESGTLGVNLTANTGQVIKWPNEQPAWSSMYGKLFEISIVPLYSDGTNMYVVCYANEISLT